MVRIYLCNTSVSFVLSTAAVSYSLPHHQHQLGMDKHLGSTASSQYHLSKLFNHHHCIFYNRSHTLPGMPWPKDGKRVCFPPGWSVKHTLKDSVEPCSSHSVQGPKLNRSANKAAGEAIPSMSRPHNSNQLDQPSNELYTHP